VAFACEREQCVVFVNTRSKERKRLGEKGAGDGGGSSPRGSRRVERQGRGGG
jgi:hypothetical protein